MGPNRVLGHTGGSQGTSLIFQSWQDLCPSTRFTGKRTWLWTFFVSQIWPPRPRNLPWDRTGYLDTREVHRKQVWFFKVDRTWGHLPGSQGRDPGSGQTFFFFFKINHLDIGTCHRTQQGTWTHMRVKGNKFDFSKFTGPGSTYQVHREENLVLDKLFFSNLTT